MEVLLFLALGSIIIVCIIILLVKIIVELDYNERVNRAEYIERVERNKMVANAYRNQLSEKIGEFNKHLSKFFRSPYGSYQDTYTALCKEISDMQTVNSNLKNISPEDDYTSRITVCCKLAEDFRNFGNKKISFTQMMDTTKYGSIQKEYWDLIHHLSKNAADTIISNIYDSIYTNSYLKIFAIDIEVVLRCIWVYAIEKPYSAESFNRAVSVFKCLVDIPHVDVMIAELYALKQVGGEDILSEKVRTTLKNDNNNAKVLSTIASALMWINAYQTENLVLQHMLKTGMQMSPKMQERLHFLTNGGKVTNQYNVSSSRDVLYFDVSALTWNDEDYSGLFSNLTFNERKLTYSLAIRDEDKSFIIPQDNSNLRLNVLFEKINTVLKEEYGDCIAAIITNGVALSGNGEEKVQGILINSKEYKQLGVFVYMICIGKKINIKFYTLYMPNDIPFDNQQQQAISLYKKFSPSLTMWESSIKDSILLAIQQQLNTISLPRNIEVSDSATPTF